MALVGKTLITDIIYQGRVLTIGNALHQHCGEYDTPMPDDFDDGYCGYVEGALDWFWLRVDENVPKYFGRKMGGFCTFRCAPLVELEYDRFLASIGLDPYFKDMEPAVSKDERNALSEIG